MRTFFLFEAVGVLLWGLIFLSAVVSTGAICCLLISLLVEPLRLFHPTLSRGERVKQQCCLETVSSISKPVLSQNSRACASRKTAFTCFVLVWPFGQK